MLTESMEDYLETIYRLAEQKGYVRAVDISETLGVQASSVTRMIQKLDEGGFILYEKYRNIALTPAGNRYGRFLVWRDRTLEEFLRLLSADVGVKDQVEGIEHYITPTTMGLIRNLINYFTAKPFALEDLHHLPKDRPYPDGEDLAELRAWIFKHNLED